jgi:GH25 family lysozyme M1 (1,4-beta-N-acetylmuramidase)
MTTLHGIDISHWQTGLDIDATDAQFVIIKVTDGTGYIDPAAVGFAHQIINAGLLGGAYHFYEGAGTAAARAEADHFVDQVRPVIGRALLALDFEHSTTDVAGARAFLDRVTERTGVRPLIYMSQSLTNAHDWSSVAKDYGLWVARYNESIGPTGAWSDVTMWQYTDAHHTGGETVDGDRFYGDAAAWRALAAGTKPNPTPEPEDEDMKYHGYTTSKKQPLTAGKWKTLTIDDDAAESLLSGTGPFQALVQLTADGLEPGHQLSVRFKLVDTKSGADTTRHDTYPTTEIVGTGGDTEGQAAQYGSIAAAKSGWTRRLRVEALTYDDGVVITNLQARAFQ